MTTPPSARSPRRNADYHNGRDATAPGTGPAPGADHGGLVWTPTAASSDGCVWHPRIARRSGASWPGSPARSSRRARGDDRLAVRGRGVRAIGVDVHLAEPAETAARRGPK